MVNTQAAKRHGGRSARVRRAVHDAVVRLLMERGTNFAIPDVAALAGVHPTSIYRRWETKEALLLDVAVASAEQLNPLEDTGTLVGDLTAWATGVARNFNSAGGTAFLRALVSALPAAPEGREQRGKYLRRRAEELNQVLDRARARGEAAPSMDDVLEYVLAPLYFRVLLDSRPADEAYAVSLLQRLLDRLNQE